MKVKKKSGGRLGRTEIVQVRFDPQMRFGAELAAIAEKRTLSSYIEQSVFKSLQELSVDFLVDELFLKSRTASGPVTMAEVIKKTWDQDEVQRFVNLAKIAPALLTPEEAFRWEFIRKERTYWRSSGKPNRSKIFMPFLKAMWPHLIEVTDGDQYDWKLHGDTYEYINNQAPNEKLEAYKKLVVELRGYYDDEAD